MRSTGGDNRREAGCRERRKKGGSIQIEGESGAEVCGKAGEKQDQEEGKEREERDRWRQKNGALRIKEAQSKAERHEK